jgi:hypothetical protein
VFPLPFPTWDLVRIGLATFLMAMVLLLVHRASDGWIGLGAMVGLAGAVYAMAVWLMDVDHIRQRGLVVMFHGIQSTLKANSRRIK